MPNKYVARKFIHFEFFIFLETFLSDSNDEFSLQYIIIIYYLNGKYGIVFFCCAGN